MKNNKNNILDMHPFNNFFVIDCFYNILFSILEYMNISIIPILRNWSINFVENNTNDTISIEYTPILSLEDALSCMGVQINYFIDMKRFKDDIIRGIRNGMPTGVFVDCYSETIRKDTFRKIHNDHCVLVTGINGTIVTVIEQSSMNTLNYRQMECPLFELVQASNGFEEYYIHREGRKDYRYFQVVRSEENALLYKKLASCYITTFLSNQENNMNVRILFGEKVIDYILGINDLESDYAVKIINEIINIFKLWRYMYRNIQKEVCTGIDCVIKEWSYLRMNIFKKQEGIEVNKNNLSEVMKKIRSTEKYVQTELYETLKKF